MKKLALALIAVFALSSGLVFAQEDQNAGGATTTQNTGNTMGSETGTANTPTTMKKGKTKKKTHHHHATKKSTTSTESSTGGATQ